MVPLTDYTKPGDGDYYLLARNSGKETVVEPYKYPVDGKEVLMTSLVTPIKKDGVVVGVVGIDITLDALQKLVSEVKVFSSGYGYILSNDGIFVTNPNKDVIGTNIKEQKVLYGLDEIVKAIRSGSTISMDDYSVMHDANAHKVYVPIYVGKTDTPWSFAIVVPTKEILSEANENIWIMVIVSVVGMLLFAIAIWRLAIGIVKPIKVVDAYMQILSVGDLSKEVQNECLMRNDEIGQLANGL